MNLLGNLIVGNAETKKIKPNGWLLLYGFNTYGNIGNTRFKLPEFNFEHWSYVLEGKKPM